MKQLPQRVGEWADHRNNIVLMDRKKDICGPAFKKISTEHGPSCCVYVFVFCLFRHIRLPGHSEKRWAWFHLAGLCHVSAAKRKGSSRECVSGQDPVKRCGIQAR